MKLKEMGIDWHPIRTAPKNVRILLANGELVASGKYRYPTIYDVKKEFCFDGIMLKSDATHWMPLPTPPVEPTRLKSTE